MSGKYLDYDGLKYVLSKLRSFIDSRVTQCIPAGTIELYAGTDVPDGWLICNGQTVERTAFPQLYDAIGTKYGAGDGSTTFAVPNLQGRVPVGVSSSYALGSTGGESTHKLTIAEMPSHTHAQNAHSHTTSGHVNYNSAYTNDSAVGTGYKWGTSKVSSTDDTTATNKNTGGSGAHNNMQPYIALNYIIYTGKAS